MFINQHDLNDRNAFREKWLVRRILLLRNMEEGLDHWTTGPLVPPSEFVLTTCTHTHTHKVRLHAHFSEVFCDLFVKISVSLTKVCTASLC